MTREELSDLLDCHLELADSFGPRGPFGDLSLREPAALDYRPFPGAWSIHEHVVHLLDADMAGFHRYRKAMAEPGCTIAPWDENAFYERLDYQATGLADAIRGIQFVRETVYRHLKCLLDQDWSQWWYARPDGDRVELATWLGRGVDHVLDHHEYMRRNLDAWRDRTGD